MKSAATTATENSQATGAEESESVKSTPRELRNRAVQLELGLYSRGRGPKLGTLGPFVGRTSAES